MVPRISARAFRRASLLAVGLFVAASLSEQSVEGQQSGALAHEALFVGSDVESYLRVLQTVGKAPAHPWSIRGFSFRELDRLTADTTHAWSAQIATRPAGDADDVGIELGWVAPRLGAIYNSSFPYGYNNGPLWAGRGLTTSLRAGAWARLGPLSLVLAPVAFRAENTPFDLVDIGATGDRIFGDSRRPDVIDLPQRFGDEPYARLDAGQSSLRLDLPWVAAGISTANQHWGPATEFPILLGNNAPGFVHGFIGTGSSVNVWIGSLHGRAVWGVLEESPYAWTEDARRRRFMSGAVGVLVPRGIPGLEVGGGRFFHTPWPQTGLALRHFVKPFEALLKHGLDGVGGIIDDHSDPDNQLASVFFRWVAPRGGFELFGELGREDHNWDLRDLILEPDHDSSYLLGFQKVWERPEARLLALRGEVLNTRITHLLRGRFQEEFYVHWYTSQGHTHRGQILGAVTAYGGGGSKLSAEWYHPAGKHGLSWTRLLRGERGEYWRTWVEEPRGIDVMHALGAESVMFRGRFDLTGSATVVYHMNRDFQADALNLNVGLGVQWRP